MPHHRSRLAILLAGTLTSLTLAGCGSQSDTPQSSPSSSSRTSPRPAALAVITSPEDTVVAQGALMQRTPQGPVELCFVMAESYPPQCSGPVLDGDIDWAALPVERAQGVTWTSGSVWVVGRFDRTQGPMGTVTLDRPPSTQPPAGHTYLVEPEPTFPQLCPDPYAAGGRRGAGSPQQQEALSARLEEMDGYISSWVSDGSSLFNILITGDADAALRDLRTVWPGGLCVEQHDAPTQARTRAAQDALVATSTPNAPRVELLSASTDPFTGLLGVHVLALDAATRDRILSTVAPWLAPEDVRITAAFRPLSP